MCAVARCDIHVTSQILHIAVQSNSLAHGHLPVALLWYPCFSLAKRPLWHMGTWQQGSGTPLSFPCYSPAKRPYSPAKRPLWHLGAGCDVTLHNELPIILVILVFC